MEPSEFAELYERFLTKCIRAGVEPLTPEAIQARIAEWESLGLSWNSEPQGAVTSDNEPKFMTY
jgi:hypothetical protein